MSVTLADGSVLSIAATYATSKNMTAVSNANPAVATLEASHGVAVNDIIEITSGWGGLDGRVVRVSAVATNDVTLEGVDTSDTAIYPAGAGTGTVREISTWSQVTQVMEIDSEGGDQEYFEYQFMDQLFKRRIPTVTSPVTINLQAANDVSLAWVTTVRAAQAAQTPKAARLTFRNSAKIYLNSYWSIGQMPQLRLNEALRRAVSLAVVAQPAEYST
jgi:hypothetical protein